MLKGHSSLDDLMQAKDKSSNHIPYKHDMKLKKPKNNPTNYGEANLQVYYKLFFPLPFNRSLLEIQLIAKKKRRRREPN